MQRVKFIVRWFSVPLVFVVVVAAGGFAGEGVVRLLDGRCAPDALVGGACVAPWHTTGIEWVVYVGLFVTVLAAVILPAQIAPAGRIVTAVLCAMVVAAIPLSIWIGAGWNDFRLISVEAILAAAAGVWLVRRTVQRKRSRP